MKLQNGLCFIAFIVSLDICALFVIALPANLSHVVVKRSCRPLWDNHCQSHGECCSQYCHKELHWKYGVCNPTKEALIHNGPCRPLWNRYCRTNEECCSKNCHLELNWTYGYCDNPIAVKECRPLWYNKCRAHYECCSNNCEKEPHWDYGVCGPSADMLKAIGPCRQDGFEFCKESSECCSKNCHRKPGLRYGYCNDKYGARTDGGFVPVKPTSIPTEKPTLRPTAKPEPSVKPTTSEAPEPEEPETEPETESEPEDVTTEAPEVTESGTNSDEIDLDISDCGRRIINKPEVRVVLGRDANIGEYPWQVSIQSKIDEKEFEHLCGGTIISKEYILTAAHCFRGVSEKENIRVAAGKTVLSKEEKGSSYHKVAQIINHEKYDRRTQNNDIALLKLATPLKYNAKKVPACLPAEGINPRGLVTVSGWGYTEARDSAADVLQAANLQLTDTKTCVERLENVEITSNMICAGSEKGADSCKGDSGGPLIKTMNGQAVIYGIVSFGKGCGRKNLPGVYTKVPNYLQWMKSKGVSI